MEAEPKEAGQKKALKTVSAKRMSLTTRRIFIWSLPVLLVILGLVQAFRPHAVPVDLVEIASGPFVVTIDDEGETRVQDTFMVSAPITGRMRRILLDVGDNVTQGDSVIAHIEPTDPEFLDARTQADAEAAVQAAEAALQLARAEVDKARAERDFAEAEANRVRRLFEQDLVSRQAIDERERAYRTQQATLAAANANLKVRQSELDRAQARLITPRETQHQHGKCKCIDITAPVSGQVLQILQESEGVVQAGTPLIEIGDPADLEIYAELLSTDAVKVRAGQRVIIDNWGGDNALAGIVRRVEPFGYTKISALGIEEQRVKVIIDFTGPVESRRNLGHGYRVEPRIVIWEGEDVITAPITALFRDGDAWAVFVEEDGIAVKRHIKIGHRSGLHAQITEGLKRGEQVVLHPGDRIHDGVRLTARKT